MTPSGQGPDRERVLLLECRLEQMRSQLDAARDEADRARTKLAEATAREANHARRYALLHEELADARSEVQALHQRLERSEALRAEMEGHLFESGTGADAEELVTLRRRVLADGQRAFVNERALSRLRARVEELLASRETLLTRVAEWQRMVREDGPEAADLSEFMAELRQEILALEEDRHASESREATLRQRLALAGIDPDSAPPQGVVMDPAYDAPADSAPPPPVDIPGDAVRGETLAGPVAAEAAPDEEPAAEESPFERAFDEETVATEAVADPATVRSETATEPPAAADELVAAEVATVAEPAPPPEEVALEARSAGKPSDALVNQLLATHPPAVRADLLLRLGRTGDPGVMGAIRPWTGSSEASVRAAAYEALGRLLERDPAALEPHLRRGLADADARVRRRVALAAATARGVALGRLLTPLLDDADAQVRRVAREILRQAAPMTAGAGAGEASDGSF